jgi:hypothetical protein
MIKTPEEMLELSKRDTMEKVIAFVTDSREFVPYAAQWMIDIKKLLQEDILILLKQNMENGYIYINEHLDAIHKIEQFLEDKK